MREHVTRITLRGKAFRDQPSAFSLFAKTFGRRVLIVEGCLLKAAFVICVVGLVIGVTARELQKAAPWNYEPRENELKSAERTAQ